jgi:hypothetical protein
MRRMMLLVTVGLVMALMMLVMAMPAFAAKPTFFGVGCGRGELAGFIAADSGREFGQANKVMMSNRSAAWRGYECDRFVS